LHSAVSDARRALGTGPEGIERLPRTGRILRLDDSVRSDVERFARLASRPDLSARDEALSLVRGAFLEGLGLTDWAIFDGTAARVESMVSMTALKGAAECLAQRKGSHAEWMVRQALKVSPYDERLYRALLRAADVQGNRTRLRSTMAELRAIAAAPTVERMPTDLGGRRTTWCHPRTAALYRELARGSAPAAKGEFPRL
jgi:DNA-binding SARP family transcriptional activator